MGGQEEKGEEGRRSKEEARCIEPIQMHLRSLIYASASVLEPVFGGIATMAWRYHMQEGEQEERFRSRVVYNSALHIGNQGAWTFLSDLHFLHIFSMSNPNSPANNASF